MFDREAYRETNREKSIAGSRAYYKANRESLLIKMRASRRRLKEEILSAYGGECNCCGEKTYEFLCLDHINSGGHKHRLSVGYSNTTIYNQVKTAGFPKDAFRVLCWNCNSSMGIYKRCPHKDTA